VKNLYNFSHLSNYLVIISGIFYGVLKYLMQVETEYGPRPHELQEWMQSLHIIVAPLMLLSLGMMWTPHIIKMKENSKVKRKSGISLYYLALPTVFTGYLVQVIYSERPQLFMIWAHLILSFLWTFSYLAHHLNRKKFAQRV
jgi:hypothetical protein